MYKSRSSYNLYIECDVDSEDVISCTGKGMCIFSTCHDVLNIISQYSNEKWNIIMITGIAKLFLVLLVLSYLHPSMLS